MLRRALLLATVTAACASEPQVEIITRSGPTSAQADAWADAFALAIARVSALGERELDAAIADLPAEDEPPARRRKRIPRAEAPGPDDQDPADMSATPGPSEHAAADRAEAPGPASQPIAPPRTAGELTGLVAALRDAPHRDLAPLARALADAPSALWPEVRLLLLAPRKARKADYKAFLAVIGGDVPNRYGHFELTWKRDHGHAVRVSEDWFEDLLALPSRQVSKVFRAIYRDCVLEAALLRAAAAIGRDPARSDDVADALLAAAYLHEGTFRDEVGRAIRRLGDPAVPGLLRRSLKPALPADEKEALEVKASPAYRMAEYAGYQIDRMDRAHPRKALAAVHDDPQRLAELLAAYAVARPGDAAGPLLEHVDAAIPRVREAARDAFLAYVTGPAPRPERKIVRMLGGRAGEAPAQPTYRDLARTAIVARLQKEHPDLLATGCEDDPKDSKLDVCEPEPLARAYFARLDESRRERERALIAAALAEEDRTAAIATLDALLADDPALSARAELVPTYEAAAADAAAAGDLSRSARLYRKSAALLAEEDPARADALRVQALLAEADLAATLEGRAMLLATAAALAPDDAALRARLAAGERPATAEDAALPRRLAARTGLAAGGLALLFGLAGLLRRRT
jgi:hypothetical protein